MPLKVQAMPVPSGEPEMFSPSNEKGEPVPSGPRMPGSHGDARLTKREHDNEAAMQKFLSSPAYDEATVQKRLSEPVFNGFLNARVTMEVEKQLDKKRRSDRVDKVYNKAQKVMRQFAFLADGDPEVYTDEGDLLLEYMAKMTHLQSRRKGCIERAERLARSEA